MQSNGYIYILKPNHPTSSKRGYVPEHRIVMEKHLGRYLKKGEIIDHKDRNPSNNNISNLRLANKSLNAINSKIPSHNKSGYKGVSFYKRDKNWEVNIKHYQKKIYLGRHLTKQEAAIIYNKKAQELFGDFAYLNQI